MARQPVESLSRLGGARTYTGFTNDTLGDKLTIPPTGTQTTGRPTWGTENPKSHYDVRCCYGPTSMLPRLDPLHECTSDTVGARGDGADNLAPTGLDDPGDGDESSSEEDADGSQNSDLWSGSGERSVDLYSCLDTESDSCSCSLQGASDVEMGELEEPRYLTPRAGDPDCTM